MIYNWSKKDCVFDSVLSLCNQKCNLKSTHPPICSAILPSIHPPIHLSVYPVLFEHLVSTGNTVMNSSIIAAHVPDVPLPSRVCIQGCGGNPCLHIRRNYPNLLRPNAYSSFWKNHVSKPTWFSQTVGEPGGMGVLAISKLLT